MEPLPSAGAAPDGATAPAHDPRPVNYARNGYHVANAVLIVLIAQALDTRGERIAITVLAAVIGWLIEIARRISPTAREWWTRTFGPLARPHEAYRVTSATWYISALVLLSTLFPLDAGVTGLVVLGLGDPAAAIIGRRFGRIPTMHGRTVEGSAAFVVAGFGAAWATLALWHPDAGALPVLALAAAVGGALGETVSHGRLDDNLVIPVAAAAAMTGARWMGA